MCRITSDDYNHAYHNLNHHRLKLTNFTLNLSLCSASQLSSYIPEILTLVFLPRLHGTRLEINDSKVRHDSPAFLTLYRVMSVSREKVITFACKDRVVVCDGTAFEVHVGELRVLKGLFRENVESGKEVEDVNKWGLECKCMVERRQFMGVREIEVCVATEDQLSHLTCNNSLSYMPLLFKEGYKTWVGTDDPHSEVIGGALIRQKVVVRNRRRKGFKAGLEAIPEGIEFDVEGKLDDEEEEEEEEEEKEMEEMRWAVDLGIWVACLGVGYMVSRASCKALFRRKLFV